MVQGHIKDIENQMTNLQNALNLTQKKLVFYRELIKEPSYKEITYKLRKIN